MKAPDTSSEKNEARNLVFALFAVTGISFCFLLGFPFLNHNESFLWIPALNKAGFTDNFTGQVVKIESFRPLGMANAWLGYKLSGNIYLQQLLNWLFAIGSFLLLFRHLSNKSLFALVSFVTGACFFSGYIYLFHLHGVFYGPFQLYVAWLAILSVTHPQISGRLLAITAALTLLASLYHTFALLVYCAFLGGYLLQLGFKEKPVKYIRLLIAIIITVVFAKLILQSKAFKSLQELWEGFIVSYRMAEVNKGLTLVAVLLCVLTGWGFSESSRLKAVTATGAGLLAAAFMFLHLPVLVLWVTLCLVRELFEKNFPLAGIIAATAILPLGSASGSPTYIVFVLMLCCYCTALHTPIPVLQQRWVRTMMATGCLGLGLCAVLLKAGIAVPVVASLARPIMAEQEKTRQMQEIIDWKLNNKNYARDGLVLYDAGGLPVQNSNAVDRTHRPVAGQNDVSAYIDFLSHDSIPNNSKPGILYVTFGNRNLPGKTLVFEAQGKWNGKAFVYQ